MNAQKILSFLASVGAVLTNRHFVYTSGLHGTSYINMRAVAHDVMFLEEVSDALAEQLMPYYVQVVIGPETLGRTLAVLTSSGLVSYNPPAIWCDMVEVSDGKRASFSPKLDFGRLVEGKRVAIVDDLLTTGSSIRLVANLIAAHGGEVVAAAAVVRRTPDITAEHCGVPALEVLADVPGFATFSPEECAEHGPCSRQVPVVLRPGHGHEWITHHPGYPTA